MTFARSALLDKVIAHAAAHGIGDSSLRDLAAAAGSSHRMLIYHFGSRDGLIAAIATAIEEQQRDMLGRLAVTSTSPGEMILEQWYALIRPDTLQFVRVFFEVLPQAFHGRPGTERFLKSLIEPWLEAGVGAATNLGTTARTDEIRLGIAVIRGLLIDVLATGDAAPATEALQRFVEHWPAR